VGQKVDGVQNELVGLFQKNFGGNSIVDFCVGSLKARDGRIAIQELEKQTGYSRRYLDSLFATHVGLSPKAVARIFRFQKFYRKWAHGQPYEVLKQEFEDYYYDQAHFTKEFTKMTGYSPRRFVRDIPNEFGRRITLK
jgi:methylphosphotriester-DNA--protein-cysteine methyltransferase